MITNAATNAEINEGLLTQWMKAALAVAIEGVTRGENPFGAGVYQPDGSLITLQCDQVASRKDPTAHAAVCAITAACEAINDMNLIGHWLVSTVEPCPMCLSVAAITGVREFVFGARGRTVRNVGYGCWSLRTDTHELAEKISAGLTLRGPILEHDCAAILLNHRRRG